MSDIFELEQGIIGCWGVCDDIKLVVDVICDSPSFKDMDPKHQDKLVNILIGMSELYQIKFDKTFAMFEEICSEYHKLRREPRVQL